MCPKINSPQTQYTYMKYENKIFLKKNVSILPVRDDQ